MAQDLTKGSQFPVLVLSFRRWTFDQKKNIQVKGCIAIPHSAAVHIGIYGGYSDLPRA